MPGFIPTNKILNTEKVFRNVLADVFRTQGIEITEYDAEDEFQRLYSIATDLNFPSHRRDVQFKAKEVINNIKEAYPTAHKAEMSRLKHAEAERIQDVRRSQQSLDAMIVDIRKIALKHSRVIGSEHRVSLKYPYMDASEKLALEALMNVARNYKHKKLTEEK